MASLGHRLSGMALVLFMPFHFLLLGNAFEGADGIGMRRWRIRIIPWSNLPNGG